MNGRQRFLGRLAASVAAASAAAALAASPALGADDPTQQSPFGGEPIPQLVKPRSETDPPPGFAVSAREAIAIADATDVVRSELDETPGAEPVARIRESRWQVTYRDGDRDVALVLIDGQTGEVDEAWRDFQVQTPLARGYDGAIAQAVNSPWIWLSLSVLFLVPFFDPRRPLRLLHVDLLVIIGLGLSLFFFNRAEITASVLLAYPVLGYLLVRLLLAGMRPRRGSGPLIPIAPVRWLAIAAGVLLVGRAILNVVDSHVIDIGVAGVIGADRILDGQPLYEGAFSLGLDLKGDVYGPFNYLSYIPFELAFHWDGVWDAGVGAAHAAAICFDLLCVVGLVVLGRRMRAGAEGRALGWALAFAWTACPWTLYTMNANANDALIAALGIWALVVLRSAPTRGVLIGLATAAKFGPAGLAPLFAFGDGERRWRQAALFALGFILALAAATIPFIPDGGLGEIYDRTFGYQASRGSPFSIWGQAPSLDALQPVVRLAAIALAVAVAFVPRVKTPIQIAALAGAVTIAIQLTANHWFYFYVVWFLPFALAAVFAAQSSIDRQAVEEQGGG